MSKICSFEGCTKQAYCKGLCRLHYGRQYNGRPMDVPNRREASNICSVEGCDEVTLAKGLCSKHYQRMYHRDSLETTRAPKGEGTINPYGYRMITVDGKQRGEHIVVAERALGKPLPPGAVVHHVDGNKLNNVPSNLVICPNEAYHRLLHTRQKALEECGDPAKRRCMYCKTYDNVSHLYEDTHNRRFYHYKCKWEYEKAHRHLR